MQRFDSLDLPLSGLKLLQRRRLEDSRGFLSRFYCAQEFVSFGFSKPISQINHTLTRNRGAVRGLHYQHPPHAEIKLVSCLKGEIFDVAVDLRKDSPTFLKWHAEILSAENQKSLLIPEGFAHGFQALADDCELMYFHTEMYHPESEGALNVLDSTLKIKWPLPIAELSDRDCVHAMITDDYQGLDV